MNKVVDGSISHHTNDRRINELFLQMDGLNLRWIAFQEGLETKKENLLKAKETSMQFSNLQREIRFMLCYFY